MTATMRSTRINPRQGTDDKWRLKSSEGSDMNAAH
jgi:hypothetical protein